MGAVCTCAPEQSAGFLQLHTSLFPKLPPQYSPAARLTACQTLGSQPFLPPPQPLTSNPLCCSLHEILQINLLSSTFTMTSLSHALLSLPWTMKSPPSWFLSFYSCPPPAHSPHRNRSGL